MCTQCRFQAFSFQIFEKVPHPQWRRQDCFLRGQTPVADETCWTWQKTGQGACSPGKFLKLKARKRHFMPTKGREKHWNFP